MEFIKTAIEGVWIVEPVRYGDARGYFSEVFKLELMQQHIGPVQFIQDNESSSSHQHCSKYGAKRPKAAKK